MAPGRLPRRAPLAAGLLLLVVEGRRVLPDAGRGTSEVQTEETQVPKLFASSDLTICGATEIRRWLVDRTGADEVRNIPWSSIDSAAAEFIRNRTNTITALNEKIRSLQAILPEREKAEAKTPISSAQINSGVENAIKATGSYGSIQVAVSSKCGAFLVRPRPPTGAFKAAVDAYKTSVDRLLSSGSIMVRAQAFADACYIQLNAKAGDLKSNCDELCGELAEAAQAASDRYAGALAINGRSADQIRRDIETAAAQIRQAQIDREGCEQSQSDIAVFKVQLVSIQVDMTEKHGKLMDAQNALMDAQWDLLDAQDSVAVQQAETQKTATLLQQAGAVVNAVLVRVRDAEQKTGVARSSLNTTQRDYALVQASLKSARDMSDVVEQLKTAVTDSMMKMMLYFDEAVRRPVRLMGLGDDVKVDSLFPEPATALDSAKATRASMEALTRFCSREETRRALATSVAGGLNPSELCQFGDVPSIQKDIDDNVAKSIQTVKDHLSKVQAFLDPYKGQNAMTREQVLANIAQGELVGLREVITAYGSTGYYRQYLQNWQLKGRFQDILKALSDALKRSEDANKQATAKLERSRQDLENAEQALKEASDALDGAIKAKKFVAGMHKEALAALASLQAAAAVVQKNVEALEAAVAEAQARYQAARTVLENTHKEGVSLVELLEELEAQMPEQVAA